MLLYIQCSVFVNKFSELFFVLGEGVARAWTTHCFAVSDGSGQRVAGSNPTFAVNTSYVSMGPEILKPSVVSTRTLICLEQCHDHVEKKVKKNHLLLRIINIINIINMVHLLIHVVHNILKC